ncbi:one cut domain family member 3-like [Penaeus chinensis]|uniref:one cut domain family member 3-like n=1 Tax=Penaeus chinensis TaxID=139456 RepID=UPI001FB73C3E|nr:one cut domain family member 3-like [Penaeus chinensis]
MSATCFKETFEHPLARAALALGAGVSTCLGGSWRRDSQKGTWHSLRPNSNAQVGRSLVPYFYTGVMSERLGTGGLLAAAAGGFRLGALHPLMHPQRMSPSPELYLEAHADLQPLDFSTKKGKMSPASDAGENSDSDRCSLPEEGGGALNLAPERPVWSRSSESGVSVTSASPDRPASPAGLHGPPSPMATSPPRGFHPHLGSLQQQLHAQLAHVPAAALNSTLLSQLHSNPLLFSTLQSALSKSKMAGHPFKSHLPARSSSPPPMDYPAASSSPTPLHPALARAPAGLGGLPGGAGLGGGGFGLGGGGLGGGGLGGSVLGGSGLGGGGGLLGPGALGMSSANPNTPGGLGALDGLVGGLGGGLGGGSGPGSLGGVMGGRGAMPGAQGEAVLNAESHEAYSRFRDQMLAQVTSAKVRRSQSSRTSSQGSGDAKGADAAADCNMDSSQDFAGDAMEAKARGEDGYDAGETQSCSSFSGGGGGTKRRGRASGDGVKDDAYWERRRKNNEAAKRSRDARRAKEDEIAIRAAFLEQENLKLRVEVASLKSETAKLRCMLYNS